MYESFYGLNERPFELTSDPRFLYLTQAHREALSNLQYGITSRKGITLLLGEAGTGKTTLIQAAIASLQDRGVRFIWINNPALTRDEFYEMLSYRLGFSAQAAHSKAAFVVELEKELGRPEVNEITCVIVDEAQSLPPALLEEIRLLANVENATKKVLPVVMAGQPEVGRRINAPDWRQFKQRVTLRCELMPLTTAETAAYIGERIRIAGGDVTRIITPDGCEAIHDVSGGIPRTISVVADNALISGFACDVKPVRAETVREVAHDLRLASAAAPARAVEPGEGARRQPLGTVYPLGVRAAK